MSGIGIKGIGYIPIVRKGGSFGMPPWDFDPNLITFTPGMAKRATSVFAAAPIVQGKRDGTGVGDNLQPNVGTQLLPYFYPIIDMNQGSIVFRITPEWNGNDGVSHTIIHDPNFGYVSASKSSLGVLNIAFNAYTVSVDVSAWVAGTTYNICYRWDTKNTLDGTNYACTSINDVHTFGKTTNPAVQTVSIIIIGSSIGNTSANAIIEGLTIYRRVLYDGTYGVNVGNGDEVNLITAP